MEYIKAKPASYGGRRKPSDIRYIVIHYTGNDGDTAKNNALYFANSNTRAAGAHFFIGRDGDAVKSIPVRRTAWSVGGFYEKGTSGAGAYYMKCTNSNSVSIELCDTASKDCSARQIKAARKLIRKIRKKCPNAKTVIRHWDVNGKRCPARYVDDAKWADLKKKIAP